MHVLERIMYIGPNRRSDKTVFEWQLELSDVELKSFRHTSIHGLAALQEKLNPTGIRIPQIGNGASPPVTGAEPESIQLLAGLIAETAVALQRLAGHRVAFSGALRPQDATHCRLLFEYEHSTTGEEAGELAIRLVAETLPHLTWEPDREIPGNNFETGLDGFLDRASKHVLPLDAQAIIDAAARLDVPCVKLERDPYDEFPGDFRIRQNGLLKLGHSCYSTIVDGTFCLDRNAALVPLLFDREKLYLKMMALQLPLPARELEFCNIITYRRALRAAQRIGFPVVVKALSRSRSAARASATTSQAISSAEELQQGFEQIRKTSRRVVLEKYVTGSTFHVLVVNHKVICTVAEGPDQILKTPVHPSILDLCLRVSTRLDCGMLCISLVTNNPFLPLPDTGGAVVDIDFAPQLDKLLPRGSVFMDEAAEAFVNWLYPKGQPSRIPLVAVTGTNGKTTTSKMVARIARQAGHSPGLASTSGVYVNELLHTKGDQAGRGGHHTLFENRNINIGVLETARGAVAHSGFMFDWCDVAVCLNVSRDHLGQYGIHTLEQMTELKRGVLQRARHAVVLNADYDSCRKMLPFGNNLKVYMTGLESSLEEIRNLAGDAVGACVLEKESGIDWIVLYEPGGNRLPIMPVAEIPATLDGLAAFNASNAQHAVCASHALGIGIRSIKNGLGSFEASYENTPGRLNIHHDLPFTVIMDYVHNPDGMRKFGTFVNQLQVSGRKILLCPALLNRTESNIAELMHSCIEYFDHFVLRRYPGPRGEAFPEVPEIMKSALLAGGVAEECITLVPVPEEGGTRALSMARSGDLVVLSSDTDELDAMWQEVIAFQPDCLD
jgi:UDP-N-acetylmuramyl tripeptide synthase